MFSKLYCYPSIDTLPKDAIEFDDVNSEWQDVLSNPEVGDKMGPAISVAQYPKGCTSRNKAEAISADALVFDVDEWHHHKPFSLDEIKEKLDGIRFVAWSTFNSTKEEYRWRVVIPVSTPIPANLYSSLWSVVNETWLESCGAESTRDISRFGFLPRLPSEDRREDYFWFIGEGERFDWRPFEELLEEEFMGSPKASHKVDKDFVKPSYWVSEKQAVKKAKVYFKNVHKGVKEGERHKILFKAACRLWWDFALEEEFVREVLLYINERYEKPKPVQDVEKEIIEGWKRTLGDNAVEQPEAYGVQRVPSKFITLEELKQLAVSLKRKTNDKDRIVGNRLTLLLKGEAVAPVEDRVPALFGLADALGRTYITDSPARLAGFFTASLSVMKAQSPNCPTIEDIEQRIKYVQDKLKKDEEAKEKQKKDELKEKIARAFKNGRTEEYSEEELKEFEKKGFVDHSWVVQYKDNFYIFIAGNYIGPFPKTSMINACDQYLAPAHEYVKLVTFNDKGIPRLKTREEIIKDYGWVVTNLEVSLSEQNSFLDFKNDRFVEAPLVQRQVEPEYIEEVDKWLEAFAGENYEKLLDWLAVVTFVDRPCSALYLEGPAGSGKSLLANGLAKIWTEGGPSMLQDISGKYNEDITRCPVVFADELIPDDLVKLNSTAKFRQIVQDIRRPLRRKFLPNAPMTGAIRLILAANNMDLLSTNEALSKNDIAAIKERVFHVQADEKATKYLESIGGYPKARTFVEQDLIAKHILWLSENRAVAPESRFIVKGDSDQLTRLLTTSGAASDLCNWLIRFLYKPMLMQKNQFIVAKKGRLYARAGGISEHWEQYINTRKIPSQKEIGKALKSISVGTSSKSVRVGDDVRMFREVDVKTLIVWSEEADMGSAEEVYAALEVFENKSKIKIVANGE